MTQMQPPAEPARDPFGLPMSKIAVAAFIISFLLGPLGIVFGIFGIIYTAPGVARGRGLAIAAIPISLLNIFVMTCAVGAYVVLPMITQQAAVADLLGMPIEQVDQQVTDIYPNFSPVFTDTISQEKLSEWAKMVIESKGTLTTSALSSPASLPGGSGVYSQVHRYQGAFSSGTLPVDFLFGVDGWQIVLLNAAVDDIWINPETAPAPPDSDAAT